MSDSVDRAIERFHRVLRLQEEARALGLEVRFPPRPELDAELERAFERYGRASERLARIKAKGLWRHETPARP